MLLPSIICFSQTNDIILKLNYELKKGVCTGRADSVNFHSTTIDPAKGFYIKDSLITMLVQQTDPVSFAIKDEAIVQTTLKILTLEVRKKNDTGDIYYTEKQEVAISQINTISKDRNIFFETSPDAVRLTITDETGKITVSNNHVFFLQLSHPDDNEYFADIIIQLFEKAGFSIKKGYWYD